MAPLAANTATASLRVSEHRPGAKQFMARSQKPKLNLKQDMSVLERRVASLKLRRQMEWYFTDANLSTDHLMHRSISFSLPEGWLSCSFFMKCRRIKELNATPEMILACLKDSHLETKLQHKLEESGGPCKNPARCIFIRRRQPLPPLLSKDARRSDGEVPPNLEEVLLEDPFKTMNRLKDQRRVQESLSLREVGDSSTIFREHLSGTTKQGDGAVIAIGYERVLYGDGGAYVEVNEDQILWQAWPHFFDKRQYTSYYDEYFTDASHGLWLSRWQQWLPNPSKGVLMLYAQTHSVNDRPWAPGSYENPHAWRPKGYADYRPGYYYFAADEALIGVSTPTSVKIPPTIPNCWPQVQEPAKSQEEETLVPQPMAKQAVSNQEPAKQEVAKQEVGKRVMLPWPVRDSWEDTCDDDADQDPSGDGAACSEPNPPGGGPGGGCTNTTNADTSLSAPTRRASNVGKAAEDAELKEVAFDIDSGGTLVTSFLPDMSVPAIRRWKKNEFTLLTVD
eukprot:TRINITY_DN27696_c0_g1_i1.p1 TRINITY_DN27696_c0_g1~~TRINITY_DN27696_c0_g1_i1.p1  ORF type:complete len:538 (-),score=86.89 TRINITY_DN27696_c0_g1_i1:423-1943(-)